MESVFKKLTSRPQRSIICLGLLLMLAGNWILPLTDRDEARFSEASREMIQRGDYVVPWFNGEWRLYKPALIYWCQIGSYRVLGVNDFSARLPSALFTTATALLLVLWGRRIFDSKTGFVGGAMFLTGLHIGVIGRIATADLALLFFFTLTAWSGWELTRPAAYAAVGEKNFPVPRPSRKVWWTIFYVALALGFLAKGPEAFLPLAVMVLGCVTRKNSFRLSPLGTVAGLIVTAAIIASWGIPALERTHGAFWAVGMNEQVYQRAVAVNNSHGVAGILGFIVLLPFYFLTFFVSFLPWTIRKPEPLEPWFQRQKQKGGLWRLIVPVLWVLAWALHIPIKIYRWWPERRRDDPGWYLFTVAAIVFIVFSLVKTKLPHYTAPAFPLIALWLARQISGDAQFPIWFTRRLVAMTIFILALTLGGFSFARGHMLTLNLWDATRAYVTPETKVGCFGYVEPTLVWRFRSVITNTVVLGEEKAARDFLTNQPPFILVLPTQEVASLPDTNGLRIEVQGLDVVRFKNRDLTAIVRLAPGAQVGAR